MNSNDDTKTPSVIPLNLPKIQITVKSSGEKTTRLIETKEEEAPVTPRRRPWKRKRPDSINDLVWITSSNTMFSNAILGKEDSVEFPLRDVPNLPKRMRPSTPLTIKIVRPTDRLSISAETCDSGVGTASERSTPEKCLTIDESVDMTTSSISLIQDNGSDKIRQTGDATMEFSPCVDQLKLETNLYQSIALRLSPIQVVEQTESKINSVVCDNSDPEESAPQKHSPIHFIKNDDLVNTTDGGDNVSIKTQSLVHKTSVSSEQTSNINNMFKLPFLPKRPPSRFQSERTVNMKVVDLRTKLQMKRRKPDNSLLMHYDDNHDDDVISLYAESFMSEPNQPEKSVTEPLIINPVETESTPNLNIQTQQTINTAYKVTPDQIVIDIPKEQCTSETSLAAMKNSKINDWIAKTEKCISTPIDPKKLFMGYCYSYLHKGICRKQNCKFKHEAPTLPYNFSDLSEVEFQNVLKRCISFHYIFFTHWFEKVLCYMRDHDRHDLILYLVCDVMKMCNNKMPFITMIIQTLKDMGFTFEQAINEILLTTARKNECLLDILLSFAVDEGDCIKTSWSLIATLTSFRKHRLDFGVVQDIFRKSVEYEPPDKNLCENIYKDIIVKNDFDLSKINRSILLKYISLLISFQLKSYASHVMVNYNIKKNELPNCSTLQRSPSPAPSGIPKSLVVSPERPASPKTDDFDCLNDIDFDAESMLPTNDTSAKNTFEVNAVEDLVERAPSPEIDYAAFGDDYVPSNSTYCKLDVASYLDNVRSDDSGNSSQKFSTFSNNSIDYRGYYNEKPMPCVLTSKKDSSSLFSQDCVSPEDTVEKTNVSEMSDREIVTLLSAIRKHNWTVLFAIIKKYSRSESMARQLVIQMLAAIKPLSTNNLCHVVSKIFQASDSYSRSDYQISNTLRLLGFNLLPELDRQKRYKMASDVLNIFAKNYHDFVKYEHIVKSYDRINTTDLKYVFLFKMLTRCNRYKDALRLFKHSESKLMNFCLNGAESQDEPDRYKMRVLREFTEKVLDNSVLDAKDSVTYLMLNIGVERWPDLKTYVNVLLTSMLKDYDTYKLETINMLDNVLNCWYKYLKPSVIRAYLINLYKDVSQEKILELFHLCIDADIYPSYETIENSILIPSDLLEEEIYLLVRYHLLKICGARFPVSNIVIKVEVPLAEDEYSKLQPVLGDSEAASSSDMVRRILGVLSRIKNFPHVDSLDVSGQYIMLPYNDPFLQPYKMVEKGGLVPPLIKFR